jgi:putative component of toxin-antitoxin plasmid stabilization module
MKRLTAKFFRTESGNEPVRDWLKDLAVMDRKIVGIDIATVEFGWPIGMPTCRPLRDGLAEVRSTIRSGKVEARVYFAIDGSDMILLNGHDGKGDQGHHIDLAIKRWKQYKQRKEGLKK